MSALVGTLRREQFVDETWILDADDGQSYQLVGEIPSGLIGRKVRVQGERADAGFGFAMAGEVIAVRAIRPA